MSYTLNNNRYAAFRSDWRCQLCHQNMAYPRQMLSNYIDERRNWNTLCDECYDEIQDYWREMWQDYYSGR